MNRRDVALALLALGAAPLASVAQPPGKIQRIGFLGASSSSGFASRVDAFRTGLRELGYVEGKNITIEYRWADDKYERLPKLAAELARLSVDVIVTSGTPGVRAAKQATKAIPIVMAAVGGDPVALGLVASLARPGGNVTGSTFVVTDFGAKRPEMLKEAIPHIRRCALLLNPDNPSMESTRQVVESAASLLRIELPQFKARDPNEFDGAFSAMANQHVEAVILFDDSMFNSHSKLIAALAAKHGFASIGNRQFAEAGGLMSYGPNVVEFYRRAATYVDKILKGAKPADLPIEQPTTFELVVNMKTAKALGIKIPQSILLRADQVIE